MTTTEVVLFVISCISGVVGITSLITFLTNRKQKIRDEGTKDAVVATSLDTIKLQNETLLQGNRQICDKLDGQNIRLSRIEQTVEDAHLAEIPSRLAALEASVKSAHHRIDGIENKSP